MPHQDQRRRHAPNGGVSAAARGDVRLREVRVHRRADRSTERQRRDETRVVPGVPEQGAVARERRENRVPQLPEDDAAGVAGRSSGGADPALEGDHPAARPDRPGQAGGRGGDHGDLHEQLRELAEPRERVPGVLDVRRGESSVAQGRRERGDEPHGRGQRRDSALSARPADREADHQVHRAEHPRPRRHQSRHRAGAVRWPGKVRQRQNQASRRRKHASARRPRRRQVAVSEVRGENRGAVRVHHRQGRVRGGSDRGGAQRPGDARVGFGRRRAGARGPGRVPDRRVRQDERPRSRVHPRGDGAAEHLNL